MNTMPQIKDVTIAFAEARQNRLDFLLNSHRRSVKHRRIHISLQSNFIPDAAARIRDVNRPVQTERITTCRGHRFKPLAAPFSKQGDRYTATVIFADQSINDLIDRKST